jgi:hypothetical protein
MQEKYDRGITNAQKNHCNEVRKYNKKENKLREYKFYLGIYFDFK